MVKLHEIIDVDKLSQQVRDGMISCRMHPNGDLRIYNYTRKCQYDWNWTPETITCRGLIVDSGNDVVARPWRKFFSADQYKGMRNGIHHLYGARYKDLYKGDFSVTEKMDGCMGILYWVDGEPAISTRGSFTSPQAELATEIFRERYADTWRDLVDFNGDNMHIVHPYTFIFECILPQYRIVVDYEGMNDVVLLGAVDNNHGWDIAVDTAAYRARNDLPPLRESYSFDSLDEVFATQRENHEGFVIKFHDTGMRVKVKHEEYMKLHRIMTGCTKRTIWDLLRQDEDIRDLIVRVPDEFFDWVIVTAEDLGRQFDQIKEDAMFNADMVMKQGLTRKDQAEQIQFFENQGLIWNVIDGKIDTSQATDSIWRMIRPEAETPWSSQETE